MSRMPNRIKEWREARGLTQVQLANLIGCNHTYIGRLESGTRKLKEEYIRKLAKALRIGPEDLFTSDDLLALQRDADQIQDLLGDMTTEQRRILLELARSLVSKPQNRVS